MQILLIAVGITATVVYCLVKHSMMRATGGADAAMSRFMELAAAETVERVWKGCEHRGITRAASLKNRHLYRPLHAVLTSRNRLGIKLHVKEPTTFFDLDRCRITLTGETPDAALGRGNYVVVVIEQDDRHLRLDLEPEAIDHLRPAFM